MKILYVFSLIVLVFAIIMSLGFYVRVPEPIPEKMALRIMEGCLKGLGIFIGVTATLGVSQPFSPFLKNVGNNVYRVCTTGNLWMSKDNSLRITDQLMSGVSVRVYEPLSSIQQTDRPVFVFMHGGGWTFLSIDNYDHLCQKLAKDADVVVISLNHRLAPQNPYPAGLDDVVKIVTHVSENANSLGIDSGRIAVGGDSSGGNLAAAAQLRPEMRGKISMLLLLVPVLQAVNLKTIGFKENVEYLHDSMNSPGSINFFLGYLGLDSSLYSDFLNNLHTTSEFKQGRFKFLFDQQKFLPKEFIRSEKYKHGINAIENIGNETTFQNIKDKLLTPTCFPLMASDEELSRFPFTYVMAAGYDLIRDDAIMFAERLKDLDVEVQLSHIPDGFHNALVMFEGPLKTDVGVRTVNDIVKALKRL
ncbi:neutral cholesterol ester hydrolase 1-like [Crassostrea virginica]